ncbi:hypothetical protein D917_00801 [Trichinella nativa]|uniref:Uncharacterized protein n=1 Tax=Trichinella nativa TaxID=6335 RepID=A0A1Y3E868_9BILA|nr:hypothetical protein D917_00801 [Trichinella nativa]
MDPNWKGIKSLMDFYPKSESNAKTGKDAPTDLADESPQQPVRQKFPVITIADRLSCAVIYPLGARHKELPGRRTLGL